MDKSTIFEMNKVSQTLIPKISNSNKISNYNSNNSKNNIRLTKIKIKNQNINKYNNSNQQNKNEKLPILSITPNKTRIKNTDNQVQGSSINKFPILPKKIQFFHKKIPTHKLYRKISSDAITLVNPNICVLKLKKLNPQKSRQSSAKKN